TLLAFGPQTTPKTELVKPGEWFTMEVIARGPRIVVKVNGQTMVDFPDDHANRFTKGHVALQVSDVGGEESVVRFRKIAIKELPPAEEPGWVQLFNGKDLDGWKTHKDQPGNWHVKDGTLTCTGKPSHLFTERGDYTNFKLRAQARVGAGGDS